MANVISSKWNKLETPMRAMTVDAKAQSTTSHTPSSPGVQEKDVLPPAPTAFGATVEKLGGGSSGELHSSHPNLESESPQETYAPIINSNYKAPYPFVSNSNGTMVSNLSGGSSGSGTLAYPTVGHPSEWTPREMLELGGDSSHPVEIDSHAAPVEIDTFSGEGRIIAPAELESPTTTSLAKDYFGNVKSMRPFSYEGSHNRSKEDIDVGSRSPYMRTPENIESMPNITQPVPTLPTSRDGGVWNWIPIPHLEET